ncbi:hypothetical protein Tco_0133604, partial [Tanacetum coccineum]
PTANSADRPHPAGWSKRPATVSAGRPVTAGGSDPVASRNRPAANSADRPHPASWSKRPATVSAGRPVSAGWLNPAARPYFRPSSVSREALSNLEASRPDIMFAVSACSRHQVIPLTSHLNAVKKIFKYLKGLPKLGLWYPKDSPFQLEAYSDSDYASSHGDRKSTTGGCQFLGRRLILWQCKKQTIMATSSTEADSSSVPADFVPAGHVIISADRYSEYADLSYRYLKGDDKLCYDSDIKVVNILLLGLPVDIYTLNNHCQTAKLQREIQDRSFIPSNRVKEILEGTKITKQERECMPYDEFDKFTSEPRESIHSCYLRYAKLINDMNMIPMSITPMQINTKSVNHLQPEWSRHAKLVEIALAKLPLFLRQGVMMLEKWHVLCFRKCTFSDVRTTRFAAVPDSID